MTAKDLTGVTVLFDLDGTLVDTAPDLIGTLNRLLVQRGYPAVAVAESKHLVGHGARALLEHGFAEAGAAPHEATDPALFDAFLTDYVAHIADHSRPFEGAVAALERLAARGAILAVATNKRTDLSLALLDALDLTRHFAAVVGPDRVSARKPSGAHLHEAVVSAGGDPARAVMVGDSTIDTGAARDAAMPCIVAAFGYNDAAPDAMGGEATLDHYDQIDALIDRLLSVN